MPDQSPPYFLDHYCERIASGLWNEPFNLLSNLAFIAAGILVWRLLNRQCRHLAGPTWDITLLTLLLFAIGIGSALWHLLATRWSLFADTIPILLFINLYLLSSLFRIFRLSIITGLGIFIIYHVTNFSIQWALPGDFLNGSIFYLPTWGFLLGITLAAWKQQCTGYRYYIAGFTVFTISLLFRTIDQSVCAAIPTGTHFIWHLLNAVTLYLLMRGLLYNAASHKTRFPS